MAEVFDHDRIAIEETKARYCRFLDEKNWDGYSDLFAQDAVLDARGSGGGVVKGRNELVASVQRAIGSATTAHQVHSPEMTCVDLDTVDVIWAMQDRVIWSDHDATNGPRGLTGYGHYRERYVRCSDMKWRIKRSSLTRLHMDFDKHQSRDSQ